MAIDLDWTEFNREVVSDLAQQTIASLQQLADEIAPRIRELIGTAMRQSDEYQSLLDGQLWVEFGLADPAPMLASVVVAIQTAVQVNVIKSQGDVLGSIEVAAMPDTFEDALAASGAEYFSVNRRGESTLIPWLRWLLFEGTTPVVVGHEIIKRKFSKKWSRTGEALMMAFDYRPSPEGFGKHHASKGRLGPQSAWSVPAAFAGISSANWLTKVAEVVQPQVESLLQEQGGN